MTATPGYYPDGRYGEPDEPAPDDEYWDEDEPILATESELAYWRKRNQHRPATESEGRMTELRWFVRDYWLMLPSQLRSWGPIKGFFMAYLWARFGREERNR
jgi:hypothetical protein